MLTIKPIKNATDASHYYHHEDNYYLKDKESLDESSSWYGKGASDLGLLGQVEPSQFLELLSGRLPSGQQLGMMDKEGKLQHRPATDITLSAPKSVSILGLIGEDERILKAHDVAVRATMDAIETMAAEARISINGEAFFEKTANLVISRFRHTTSRELDPQLHDHCIILNMTKRLDGKWRALSSRSENDKANPDNGFREILYRHQHYFGLIYNATLAKEVCDIGYDIEVKDQYGNFEIKGLSQDFIEKCSKRREQILTQLEKKGLTSSSAAEIANLETRRIKESIDSKTLTKFWKEEAKQEGVNLSKLIDDSKNKNKGTIETNTVSVSLSAKEAVDDAIEHLSAFQTKIKHLDLVRTAYVFATGLINHLEIEADISARRNEKALLGVASEYYTTAHLLEQEKSFIKQCKKGFEASFSLSVERSGLAGTVLKNSDRMQLIDVKGFSNEKHLIENMVHESEAAGLTSFVLHVGRLQANRLGDSISRDNSTLWKTFKNLFKAELVQTVAGFSAKYDKQYQAPCSRNDMFIVHDAQKLSYKDLMLLDNLAARTESKVILLNNTRSTEGFYAGSPIKALKDAGFIAERSKSHEKNSHMSIIQTDNASADLAAHFALLSDEKRKETKVIALTHKDAVLLTKDIREQLQKSGALSRQTKEVITLSTQTLSDTQKKHIKFYDIHDQITFNAFEKEQSHFKIVEKNDNALILQGERGVKRTFLIGQEKDYIVTKSQKIAISVGEHLVVEKNIRLNRMFFKKGESFFVEGINEGGVTIRHKEGVLSFPNEELAELSLGYHYVRKPNSITKEAVDSLVALKGYQLNKNVMGELAEVAPRIKIFTDNKDKAIESLDKSEISWTISDVSKGKATRIYREVAYALNPINQDLEALSKLLTKDLKECNPNEIATLAVSYATAKLSERDAAFEHKELLTQSLNFALGKVHFEDVEKAILEKAENGDLIHANTFWVSKEALALETAILKNNKEEQDKLLPISNHKRLLSLPDNLTQGQKDAVILSLTTKDRFVSVQGLAGVGKTTMMKTIQSIAKEHDFSVVGLAPMHTSKDELIAVGIDAMTIAQFLQDSHVYEKNTLFIIDEASMIGNRDYLALQEKMKQLNVRGLMAGDITQLQSPTSGIPHELTIKTNTQKIAYMTEILRQKDSPVLKKAVIHASNREIKESFSALSTINPEEVIKRQKDALPHPDTSVVGINCYTEDEGMNYHAIYVAIANDYLSRIPEHQEKTMVIAHTHEDRASINMIIRNGLQIQGKIGQENTECMRFAAKSMTKAELMHVANYEKDDVIRFDANYSIVKKGDYFTVNDIDKEKNHLHCTSLTGETFSINPASFVLRARPSVYTKEEAALSKGDSIRLRLTDKARGHIANKEYQVDDINDGIAFLKEKNTNHTLELNLYKRKDMHWDYAYTRTAFGAQSATETFVLALELSKRINATTHRSHEIDITRPRTQVTIYTENKSELINRLSKLKGDKVSAYRMLKDKGSLSEKKELSRSTPSEKSVLKPNKKPSPSINVPNAKDINESLTHRIEGLAEHLLGTPNQSLSNSTNLRFGNKGSISINTTNGLWTNFETGEKGNALQLITAQMGFKHFKETIAYAQDFLNETPSIILKKEEKTLFTNTYKDSPNKKDYAIKLVKESVPLEGTLAETYLKKYRQLSHFSKSDLRFIANITTWHGDKKVSTPALLCIGKTDKGDINHVQVIRLDKATGDKDKNSRVIKQTYGSINGCPIELNPSSKSTTTYLTEGVETGLSILEANPDGKVMALIGKSNFLKIDLTRLTKEVIFCLDNDKDATLKDGVIKEAVKRLSDAGKTVSIIYPEKEGQDFNDVLKNEGVLSVKKYLDNPIKASNFIEKETKKHGLNNDVQDLDKNKNPQKNQGINTQLNKITELENNQLATLKTIENQRINHLKQTLSQQQNKETNSFNKAQIKVNYSGQREQKTLELER